MTGSRHDDISDRCGSGPVDDNVVSPDDSTLARAGTRHDDDKLHAVSDLVRTAIAAVAHPVPMPADVAERIRSRLIDENAETGPTEEAQRPPRSCRRTRRATVLLAAAVVVGTLVGAPVVLGPAPGPVGVAGHTPEALRRAADVPGRPADPGWVRACLTAAGAADPAAPLLGSRPYAVAGEPGVLLVLGTGRAGRHRLVVVPAGCGPDTARVLAETVTG
jgi:hypothetical protein